MFLSLPRNHSFSKCNKLTGTLLKLRGWKDVPPQLLRATWRRDHRVDSTWRCVRPHFSRCRRGFVCRVVAELELLVVFFLHMSMFMRKLCVLMFSISPKISLELFSFLWDDGYFLFLFSFSWEPREMLRHLSEEFVMLLAMCHSWYHFLFVVPTSFTVGQLIIECILTASSTTIFDLKWY